MSTAAERFVRRCRDARQVPTRRDIEQAGGRLVKQCAEHVHYVMPDGSQMVLDEKRQGFTGVRVQNDC